MRFSEIVAQHRQNHVRLSISKLQRTNVLPEKLYAIVYIHQVKTPYIQPAKQVKFDSRFNG
jgi:hypothetical protein